MKKNDLKIGFIANKNAGKGKYIHLGYHDRFTEIAKNIMGEKNLKKKILFRISESLEEISKIGKDLNKNKVDIIAIFGGDGTIQKTLTRLHKAYGRSKFPPVLLLRGGTMNLVGRSMKLKNSPERRWQLFLENATKANLSLTKRKTLNVNGELGFIYGLGLSCNFIDMYDEGGDAGPWKAIKMSLLTLSTVIFHGKKAKRLFAKIHCTVEVDGTTLPFKKMTLMLAQTIPNLAFGVHITYRAYEKEGTCHTIISEASPFSLALRLYNVFFKRHIKSKKIFYDLASKIKIQPSHPCKYMLDGEIFSHDNPQKPIIQKMGPSISFAWYNSEK